MIDLSWFAVPLGLGLILLSLLDVFMTVLHVQVESPISNKLNRWFWHALVEGTRPLGKGTRDQVLAWGAPLMIGGIIVFWALLYILGFGLLYLPVVHDPAIFSIEDGALTTAVGDAFYFSAVSFFTIGYGDIVPVHPLARFVGVLEGAFGLLTISLSVTYLLSVYPLISRKVSMAVSLNQETAGRPDGIVVAERYVEAGRFAILGERLRTLNDELLNLGQAHGFFPILYYVRPKDVHQSFVRILVVIQGLVATLRYGLDPATHRDVVTDPRLTMLEEALLYTLHALADSSHLAPRGETEEDLVRAHLDHAALLDELAARGLSVAPRHDRSTAEAHARFRAATDRYIGAYAENAGYEPSAVWATYDRWARDSALVGHTDVKANGRRPS